MPYIRSQDRSRLMPLILALKDKTMFLVERTGGDELRRDERLIGYLRHIAMRVLEETALKASEQYHGERKRRYWMIVDQAGICMNIAYELYDRVLSKQPASAGGARAWFSIPMAGVLPAVPEDADELNPAIDALIAEISAISGPKEMTGGYDYDSAYCGPVNFSLTELAPRALMDFQTDLDFGRTCFYWESVENLITFWLMLVPELYLLARKYEDGQIEKNGDVEVYQLMLDRLRA